MSKKMKQMIIGIGVIALFSSAQVVYAQPHVYAMERMRASKEKRFDKLAEELNLTDEQKEQIKAQRDAQKEATKGLRDEFHQEIKNLREELEKPDTNREQLGKITTKIKILGSDLLDQRVESILAVKEVLTPQQFKQLNEKRKARREKFKKFHKKMMKEKEEEEFF